MSGDDYGIGIDVATRSSPAASRHSAKALDPDKLDRLGRYEVHLDRKLERMLTMLLRFKDLRRTTVEG